MFHRVPTSLRAVLIVLGTVSAAFLSSQTARADDRDLLRDSAAEPLVFVIFDTSGSMYWSPKCTQEQFDAGVCDVLCPTGDCFVPANGDDPSSKFFQAKQALFEVMDSVTGVNFGFATYNQDDMFVRHKHWLYEVAETQPGGSPNNRLTLLDNDLWPEIFAEEVFGASWTCDEGGGDNDQGCWADGADIADMDDDWEIRRTQRLPKIGHTPYIVLDQFNADALSGDDGNLPWTDPWIETDGNGLGATTGNARIEGGVMVLTDRPDSGGRPGFRRRVDLTPLSRPDLGNRFVGWAEVSFDWETTFGVDPSDAIDIEVSDDGGSNWDDIGFINGISGVETGRFSADISPWISDRTMVRIRIGSAYGGPDEFFIVDNFQISSATTVYQRDPDDGQKYKLVHRPLLIRPDNGQPNVYGNDQYAVDVEIQRCTNDFNRCRSRLVDRETIWYDLLTDYVGWDFGAKRTPRSNGFFFQSRAGDAETSNTCSGWDGNDDTPSDEFQVSSINALLRWPTVPDPPPFRFDENGDGLKETRDFEIGDVIPLDWETGHKELIMSRLAPNRVLDPAADPDFRVATYLENRRQGSDEFLRLKDARMRPLVADGSTPLGNSLNDFRIWYNGCDQATCGATEKGWIDIAQQFDKDFNCRKKFIIVLTDGADTCPGTNPCDATRDLRSILGFKTYVVAFGVDGGGGGGTLACMATNGGTGDPIFPQDKDELVSELTNIFNEIKVQARSFAAASVPTVQNESSDRVFLSSFTPLPNKGLWPGRVDAFRKPMPLRDDGTPDFERGCETFGLQSACHLWDAAEEVVAQAPRETDLAASPPDFKIGEGIDKRRVLQGRRHLSDSVPTNMRLFVPPTNLADELDMWDAMGIDVTIGDATSEQAARDLVLDTIEHALVVKTARVPSQSDPDMDEDLDYVLGDIFHADPLIVGGPSNLLFFRENLNDYQTFSRENFWRRRLLVISANDGQVHFFDAGIRTDVLDSASGESFERFTDGTGRELFSYMPRMALPAVRHQATEDRHVYSMDGSPVVADVFIDPLHGGNNILASDRGWRTVLVGGMREGGDIMSSGQRPRGFNSGYYALDITQPDRMDDTDPSDPEEPFIPKPEGSVLPSCLRIDTITGEHEAGGSQPLSGPNNCKSPAGTDYPFPAELWTFLDQAPLSLGGPFFLDEENTDADADREGNDQRDLGDTWSVPVIGRIQICADTSCDPDTGADLEDRYVAIFGGGLDASNPLSSQAGSWLYMVDIETGKTIYKRQLDGAAPAGPTVLDTDRDGYFDFIYIGTTRGYFYKVDLTALDAAGDVPRLEDVTIDNTRLVGSPLLPGVTATVRRITDAAWEPFKIYDTGGRPIFLRATAFNVPDLDQFALAFGTGNRHNLWDESSVVNEHFITLIDENLTRLDSLRLPRVETDYTRLDFDQAAASGANLSNPSASRGTRGWIVELSSKEKVTSQAFILVGVMSFSTFSPDEKTDLDGDGDDDACSRSGVSRIFVVDAETADGFVDLDPDVAGVERFRNVGAFTTAPYIDQTSTKNPENEPGSGPSDKTTESALDAEQLALQEAIRQSLMRFFPEGCRYNRSYSMTINASRDDTTHERFATIPIAMCPVDWQQER